jgi:hypothetical protein
MLNDLRFAAHEPVNAFFILIGKVTGVKPSLPDIFGGQFQITPVTRGHPVVACLNYEKLSSVTRRKKEEVVSLQTFPKRLF